MEAAALQLAETDTFGLRSTLADQLLAKAENVCGLTGEQFLLNRVRSFGLILDETRSIVIRSSRKHMDHWRTSACTIGTGSVWNGTSSEPSN
jgi:hypothetical protein